MKIRPFLSHKREMAPDVTRLKRDLCMHGAGGWQDVDDLRLGTDAPAELRRVIAEDVGGFLFWGTRSALTSATITQTEIPAALARADREPFAIVPVFVDLDPLNDRASIKAAIDRADDLLNRNGIVRGRNETVPALSRRVAKRYVEDAVRVLPAGPLRLAFRVFGTPDGRADLTFDWRSAFAAETRSFRGGGLPRITDALAHFRACAQGREQAPSLEIETDLPLPLAVLVGYELRETTRMRLSVIQRTGSRYSKIPISGRPSDPPTPIVEHLRRRGPVVVVVSCGSQLTDAARRYANSVRASEVRTRHVPGVLNAPALRGLALAVATDLREFRDRAVEKHVLILGPGALAIAIGAASNGAGPITVPFWRNDTMTYTEPLVVGNP